MVQINRSYSRGKAEDANSWRIVLGKHQLRRSETAERVFPVKRIYRHENFRYPAHSELDYDIALVKAATDILPSNFIRYACLPRKKTILKPGQYCWVTGWGDTRGEFEGMALHRQKYWDTPSPGGLCFLMNFSNTDFFYRCQNIALELNVWQIKTKGPFCKEKWKLIKQAQSLSLNIGIGIKPVCSLQLYFLFS